MEPNEFVAGLLIIEKRHGRLNMRFGTLHRFGTNMFQVVVVMSV